MSLEYQAFLIAKSMHRSDLISDIKLLWKSMSIDRADHLSIYTRKPALKRAYLSYYWALYAIKVAQLIKDLNINFTNPPKVLDLGAGPLSATMGALLFYKNLSSIFAVDKDVHFMKIGLDLMEILLNTRLNVNIARTDLKGLSSSSIFSSDIDLILAAHVLNEFGNGQFNLEKKKKLIFKSIKHLSKDGVLLLIEPASRTTSRDIMRIRDWVQDNKFSKIIAPCHSEVLRCPLLISRSNWCHSEISYKRPYDMQEIDRRIGLEKESLKLSYLALTRKDSNRISLKSRIVSGAMHDQCSLKHYVCTVDGLKTLSMYKNNIFDFFINFKRGKEIDLNTF